MSAGSWRTVPLPSDWGVIRRRILARDGHRCTHADALGRCPLPATEVDHAGAPDDHRDEALRSLCAPHHLDRTKAQRAEALARRPMLARPTERHPGLT